jgi:uncharacterized protein YndB with AHSA1/START domain
MPGATIIADEGTTAIRLERALEVLPLDVWRSLTERERLRQWFPCDVLVLGSVWEVGAKISFIFPSEEIELTVHGVVLDIEVPYAVAYTWGDETLRFDVRPMNGGGTRLVLVDELDPRHAARNAAGWEVCLDRLSGTAPGAEAWSRHFAHYVGLFEAQLGPQEGPPAGHVDVR